MPGEQPQQPRLMEVTMGTNAGINAYTVARDVDNSAQEHLATAFDSMNGIPVNARPCWSVCNHSHVRSKWECTEKGIGNATVMNNIDGLLPIRVHLRKTQSGIQHSHGWGQGLI
jgi:hypothetical protein